MNLLHRYYCSFYYLNHYILYCNSKNNNNCTVWHNAKIIQKWNDSTIIVILIFADFIDYHKTSNSSSKRTFCFGFTTAITNEVLILMIKIFVKNTNNTTKGKYDYAKISLKMIWVWRREYSLILLEVRLGVGSWER